MRSSFFFYRTTGLFCALASVLLGSLSLGCTPADRDFASSGVGGAASSAVGAGGSGGEESVSSSSASSGAGGSPAEPGDLLRSGEFPGTALLFDLVQAKNGGSLLAGRFSNTIDFGDGPLIENGGSDIFLARFGPADAHLSSKAYGDAGFAGGVHAAMDPSGNMYLTGDISDNSGLDFGGNKLLGPGAWVAGLDPLGGALYSSLIPAGMASPTPYGIAADDAGETVYAGFFQASFVVSGNTLASVGDTDVFVIRNDPNGNVIWAKRFGGMGHDNASAVAFDPVGGVAIAGYFESTVMFNQMNGVTSAGGSDVFVARLGPAGASQWAKSIGGPGHEFIFGTMAVTSTGEIVVAGSATDEITVDSTSLPPAGGTDVYVAKFASNGALLWANRYGDMDAQDVYALAVDTDGNILVGGPFSGEINFGSGSVKSPAGNGAYLAKLDPSGKALFTKVYAGYFESMFIEADGLLSVLLAGSGTSINLGDSKTLLPTGGVFMARIAP